MVGGGVHIALTKQDVAVLSGLAIVASPVLLTGGVIYGAARGVGAVTREAKHAAFFFSRRRRAKAAANFADDPEELAARFPDDSEAQLKLALMHFSANEMQAAFVYFDRAVNIEHERDARHKVGNKVMSDDARMPRPRVKVLATYFATLCCAWLGFFRRGAALAGSNYVTYKYGSPTDRSAPTPADRPVIQTEIIAVAARLDFLAVEYRDDDRDATAALVWPTLERTAKPLQTLQSARDMIDEALEMGLRQGNQRPPVRTLNAAAWIDFRLGLRADDEAPGQRVVVDRDLLHKARAFALRAVHEAAEDARSESAARGTPIAAGARDAEALIDSQRAAMAALETAGTTEPEGPDDEAQPTQQPQVPAAMRHGAAELLSLLAQIYLATGDADDAAKAHEALAAARELHPAVPHCGLLEGAPDGVDPRLGLLRPWPTRSATPEPSAAAAAPVDNRTPAANTTTLGAVATIATPAPAAHRHQFLRRRAAKAHECAVCGRKTMPLSKPLQCSSCEQFVHHECYTSSLGDLAE
jgi:tetratricopeptide (TPR) repeat protein